MKKLIWSYFSLLLLLASCSTTKSLSEGDVLYTGSRIQIKKANSDEEDWKIKESAKKISHLYLELWDTPNGALFGLPRFQVMPTKLWIYNIFYTKKDKKFARWMRRNFGEPPITIQQVNPASKIAKAVNLYENFGHFGTTGNYYLKYNKRKNKAYVRYELMVTKPYLYRFIKYKIDSSHSTINDSFLEYKSVSKIKPEDEFNLDIIKNEKIDLWRYLQNDGFYYLKPDNIIVDADTTVGHKKMDMQFSIEDGLSDKVYERQKIDQFNITIDSIDQKNVDDKFYHWSYGKIRKNLLNGVVSVKRQKLFVIKYKKIAEKPGRFGCFQ